MDAREDAEFRLRLAKGFLAEAQQDVSLQRWRSCVDNSQLSTENAAKAVLSLLGPVGRTHSPSTYLLEAIDAGKVPHGDVDRARRLAQLAEQLGRDLHMASDYGDAATRRTPWEIFNEP